MERGQQAYERWREDGGAQSREAYLPLVHEQAARILRRLPTGILERDEVISYGVIGLLEALEQYDPRRGVPLEAYLRTQIRRRILDGLRSQDRLPRRLRARERQVRDAYAQLEQEHLRSATDDEVAERLGLSNKEFQEWLVDLGFTTVWSIEILEEHGVEPEDGNRTPEAALEEGELLKILATAVEKLPQREQDVLAAHYDLGYSLQEVAQAMDLSERYVAALHSRAVLRLRGALSRYRAVMRGRDPR
ncbi:MAG: sigma-70 family RNA polymerase sigma factor [Thermaerobacter sp.]|nr:sigma-70 family RNA polymerase sigma factor [Thermaerobacter sp.]